MEWRGDVFIGREFVGKRFPPGDSCGGRILEARARSYMHTTHNGTGGYILHTKTYRKIVKMRKKRVPHVGICIQKRNNEQLHIYFIYFTIVLLLFVCGFLRAAKVYDLPWDSSKFICEWRGAISECVRSEWVRG